MKANPWELFEIYKDTEEGKRFRVIESKEVITGDMDEFLDMAIYRECFNTAGSCRDLWEEIEKHPKIYGNVANFKKKVDEGRERAAELMLGRDPLVFKRWAIDTVEIPERTLHLDRLKPSITQQGLHILHFPIGSGKSGLISEDVKRYGERARQLIVSPNRQDCYRLAKELGGEWKHYHHFGTDSDSVKKAIFSFDKLIICSGSLRWFREFGSQINIFDVIYVDEISQLLKNYANQMSRNAPFRESLEELFGLISLAKRTLLLSADITERNTLEILGRTASESDQKATYYKSNINYAEGSHWRLFKEEWNLIWAVVDRINNGERAWGSVDFADRKGPRFTQLVKFLKEYCPDKKIQGFTSEMLSDTPKGKRITEIGLQAYIKEETDAGRLDVWIGSPSFRHNISILHEDEKYGMDFSFGVHTWVNDPEDVVQSARRDRRIRDHMIFVANNGTRIVKERSGLNAMKKTPDPESLKKAKIGPKMKWYADVAMEQLRCQNKANKQWLTKLILEGMGAIVEEGVAVKKGRKAEYVDFRNDYMEKVIAKDLGDRESSEFKRSKLFNSFVEWDVQSGRWFATRDNEKLSEKDLLATLTLVKPEVAERLQMILQMDPENREIWDSSSQTDFYKETGILLDRIFHRISPAGSFEGLAHWYLEAAAGSTWYGLIEREDDAEMTDLIIENYTDIYRDTLGATNKVNSIKKFIEKVIAKNLELEVWTTVAKQEKSQWKQALFEQYYKSHGGRVLRSMGITERYDAIEEILKEKIRCAVDQSFSDPEKRFLDTLKDVIKISRPNRPIHSKIWEIYQRSRIWRKPSHPVNRAELGQDDEDDEIEITP